jgi:hypothetical protein
MSSPPNPPNRVFDGTALSGTNTVTSLVTTVGRNQADARITYVVDFTDSGSLSGTLTVEISAADESELNGDPNAAVAFQPYTLISPIGISAGALQQTILITQPAGGIRVRLKYVNATGTGSVIARVKSR